MAKGKKDKKVRKSKKRKKVHETAMQLVMQVDNTDKQTKDGHQKQTASTETVNGVQSQHYVQERSGVITAKQGSSSAIRPRPVNSPRTPSGGNRMSSPTPTVNYNKPILGQASVLLFIATALAVLLGAAMFTLLGGREGVPAMGGLIDAQVPLLPAQVIFLLDTLFPVFFGGGFALLATGLQTRGNRPLVRLVLTAILIAVISDFIENSMVFRTMSGQEPPAIRWSFTVVKYAGLAFAGVMISGILPKIGKLGYLSHFLVRYLFPISVAFLVSGFGGESIRDLVGISFPLALLILGLYARKLSME